MKVGYLGPRGTFTEEAAQKLLGGSETTSVELHPLRTIPEVLYAVEAGELDRGVVPIENSIEGSVSATLDALAHEVEVQICREVVLPVRHHLMAKAGISLDQLVAVYSHPQALAQCRHHLDKLLPGIELQAATSTAEAAKQASKSDRPIAALGTRLAASLYQLEILASDLQDQSDNATRFVCVGRDAPARTGHDKTSVVIAFDADRPGNLYRALKAFADAQVNLTKLESRPAKRSLGDYIFFIDMEGHQNDSRVRKALNEIEHESAFFKMLGSYPRVDYPRSDRLGNGI